MTDLLTITHNPRGWPTAALLKFLLRVMRSQRLITAKPVVLSVSFATAPAMARLNLKYRRSRGPTDILSFEQQARDSGPLQALGDLVLCTPVLRRQAREQKHGLKIELAVLLCHGLLHLLGHDHENSEKAARIMARLEAQILAGLPPKYAPARKSAGLIARARVDRKHG